MRATVAFDRLQNKPRWALESRGGASYAPPTSRFETPFGEPFILEPPFLFNDPISKYITAPTSRHNRRSFAGTCRVREALLRPKFRAFLSPPEGPGCAGTCREQN